MSFVKLLCFSYMSYNVRVNYMLCFIGRFVGEYFICSLFSDGLSYFFN